MAWEERNGRHYYYRKRRVGDKVISEYCGPGFLGRMAELQDREDELNRIIETEKLERLQKECADFDAIIEPVNKSIRELYRAVLIVEGYHKHRGEWREFRNE